MTAVNKKGIATEMNQDAIRDAIKSHGEVKLRIKRQDSAGRWSTVTQSIQMQTSELLTIEDWLLDNCGGGSYRIEAFNPANPADTVVKPFMVRLEGPERAFKRPEDPYAPQPTAPVRPGSPQIPHRGESPREYMAQTPDQIASRAWDHTKHELREERRARETERRQFESTVAAMRAELDKMREDQLKQQHEANQKMLETRMEAMTQQAQSSVNWPALLTAAAPIVAAVIESSSARASAAVTAAQASQQQQSEVMRAIVETSSKQPDTLGELMKLVPALSPMFERMLDQKDPSKMADLVQSMSDAVLTQASMSAQIYENLNATQGGDPPWMPIVSGLTDSIEKIAEGMLQHGPQPGAGIASATPQVVDGPPPGAQQATPGAQPRQSADLKADRMNQIMHSLPPYLQRQDMASIVYHMLDEDPARVPDIVEAIVALVTESDSEELAAVRNDVSAVGPALLDLVPVGAAYKQAIYEGLVQLAGGQSEPTEATRTNGSAERRPSGMLEGEQIPNQARVASPTSN